MRQVWLAALFAIVAMFALGAALAFRSADQERLDDARRANCEAIEQLKELQRHSLAEDIVASRKFLRENPQGIPGIPSHLIRAGIARDQQQFRDLAAKEC